jgi:hypothetical protein
VTVPNIPATRRPELLTLFKEVVDKTVIISGGKDTLVETAYDLGNADQLGKKEHKRNLGQGPAEGKDHSYSGTRSEDGTKWEIIDRIEEEWDHIEPWRKTKDATQPGIDKIIKLMK